MPFRREKRLINFSFMLDMRNMNPLLNNGRKGRLTHRKEVELSFKARWFLPGHQGNEGQAKYKGANGQTDGQTGKPRGKQGAYENTREETGGTICKNMDAWQHRQKILNTNETQTSTRVLSQDLLF